MTLPIQRPEKNEYAPYYETYISLITETNLLELMQSQITELKALLEPLSETQAGFRYAADKWTIREVLGHLTDTERVFSFRALAFARGEQAALPGFDQNDYMHYANFEADSLTNILAEFEALRRSNMLLLNRLDDSAWLRSGVVSGHSVTVRALAFMMAGHVAHHLQGLKTHYLAALP